MKKKLPIFLLHILLSLTIFGQAPDWAWAKRAGGLSFDDGKGIATDKKGNVYTVRQLYENSMFVAKYDSTGNLLWERSPTPAPRFSVHDISTDDSGNVYIVGNFAGTVSFGNFSLTSIGVGDIFIVKYDPWGNTLWAISGGGIDDDIGAAIATDKKGYVYITGYFRSPSISFGNIILPNTINTSFQNPDIFVAKYDSSGQVVWAKAVSGDGYDIGNSIATDDNGNIYVTGDFEGPSINFGNITLNHTTPLPFLQSSDIFIAKYNSSGDVIWAKNAGGGGNGNAVRIKCDAIGNMYVSGWFGGQTITFDNITLTNKYYAEALYADYGNPFLVKYDLAGNVIWAQSGKGSTSQGYGQGMAFDKKGNIYLTGNFGSSTISFGNYTLNNETPNYGIADLFVVKYDPSGIVLWAKSAGGKGDDFGNDITCDENNNIYVTGSFGPPSITFDTTTLTDSVVSGGTASDFFVAELGVDPTLPLHWGNFTAEKIIKKVLLKWNTYQELNTDKFIIERSADGVNFSTIGSVMAKGSSNTSSNYQFYDEAPLPGINFYRLKQTDRDGKYTYSPIRHVNFIENNNIISISPNPVKNLLRIETTSGESLAAQSSTATINIYSSAMQLVQSIKLTQADRNAATIHVDRLVKGVYFLQLVTTDGVRTVKFLKE